MIGEDADPARRVGCFPTSTFLRATTRLLQPRATSVSRSGEETTPFGYLQRAFTASPKNYDQRIPPGMRLTQGHVCRGAAGEIWNLIDVVAFNAPTEIRVNTQPEENV